MKVTYGSTFYTKQALARWLAGHGESFAGWASTHLAAAASLAAQPADTPVSDRLMVTASPKLRQSRTLEVHAHAFPGASGHIVVRSGSTSMAAVRVVIDDTGRVDSLVKLSNWSGQKQLTVTLTATYPEGPRSARISVNLAQPLRLARSR